MSFLHAFTLTILTYLREFCWTLHEMTSAFRRLVISLPVIAAGLMWIPDLV